MQTRKIGPLTVSAIGLGCMGMAGTAGQAAMYGPVDRAEAIATIHHALDIGINFFDTAEIYGPFANELLVAEALAGRRRQAIIATKFGFRIDNGRFAGVNSHPDHIRAVCEASLKRLNTDVIDLFYQHRPDPDVPVEDVAGAVGDLIREGKVAQMYSTLQTGASQGMQTLDQSLAELVRRQRITAAEARLHAKVPAQFAG